MFERYTERARRTLFFARYESSQLGDVTIDTEHILLGLLRENKGLTNRIFERAQLTFSGVHAELEAAKGRRERIPTSVEIPFAEHAMQALLYAAEESDRLLHSYIGNEHVLLGLLRVDGSVASSILARHNLQLNTTREAIVKLLNELGSVSDGEDPKHPIELIQLLMSQHGERLAVNAEARELLERIRRDLDALKRLLG
jgi:ATP-dependent Clp protease ATP-binding subunit ClpC